MSLFHHEPEIEIVILESDRDEVKLLKRILHALGRIEKRLPPLHRFSISVTLENRMAISVGTSGTFTATLEDNGVDIALPAGSTFAWTADDTSATITPSADSLSAVIAVPASDTATTITVTASTTAPDGSKVSGSVTVPITPGVAHTFTVNVVQVS
jgi:hypothetical protein